MNTFNLKPTLKFFNLLYFLFFFVGNALGQFPQMGRDLYGDRANDWFGFSTSISSNGDIIAVGVYSSDGIGGTSSSIGQVNVYYWNGSDWILKGSPIDGESPGDISGRRVSLSSDGTVVAIGAPYNDDSGNNAGHVRVYEWDGIDWVQRGMDIDGESADDQSGRGLSLSGNGLIVAVGGDYNDGNGNNAGHVRIYEWNGVNWVQRGMDIDGESADDQSGFSVSLNENGNILGIGAGNNDGNGNNAGHVRIYEWDGIAWVQRGMDIDGEFADDRCGSVSLNSKGDVVMIGATFHDANGISNVGQVRVYEWDGIVWNQKGTSVNGEFSFDYFGGFISINDSADIMLVGAIGNDGVGFNAGHARLYKWTGVDWVQHGDDIDAAAAGDAGGVIDLSSNGRVLVMGSYKNDYNYNNAGQVRVFRIPNIYGNIFFDVNQNCQKDSLERGIANRNLIINPGNIVVQTDSNGYWGIDSLPVGNYTVTTDISNSNNYQSCQSVYTFWVTNPDSFIQVSPIAYQVTNQCVEPAISFNVPFLRRGFSYQRVYIQACNNHDGTAVLDSGYVIVTLDSSLTVDTASISYTALGNNQYRVDLDSLYPGQCANFWFDCTLSQSAILGSSLCMNAKLYPIDACVLDTIPNSVGIPCNTTYDNSHLDISSNCITNDTISFTITNTGSTMTCWSQVRLYVDTAQVGIDSVQLASGQSQIFNYAGDGRTWRMEVDQHPLHPGNSHPSTTIELCGNMSNWTSNLVNVFPQDDADPVVDIYCGLVTGSYDPNDKTGYPLGVGATNDILPNQKLEYLIRFQNTGTDTAFTVVIRDTLSTDFDIFSVQSGVSSHPYTFRMYGPRVLEWTFNNIMLPDSNVNEPLSNGFVMFEVNQQPNLAEGTVLENSAGIYFDFNAPIITNTSQHTINRFLRSAVITTVENVNEDTNLNIQLYPNPTTGILQLQRTTTERIQVQIIDQLGRILIEQETSHQSATVNMSALSTGLYFVHINDGQKSITEKIVKE